MARGKRKGPAKGITAGSYTRGAVSTSAPVNMAFEKEPVSDTRGLPIGSTITAMTLVNETATDIRRRLVGTFTISVKGLDKVTLPDIEVDHLLFYVETTVRVNTENVLLLFEKVDLNDSIISISTDNEAKQFLLRFQVFLLNTYPSITDSLKRPLSNTHTGFYRIPEVHKDSTSYYLNVGKKPFKAMSNGELLPPMTMLEASHYLLKYDCACISWDVAKTFDEK